MNVYDVLTERGFIEQATHPEEIRELLGKEKVTFYIGYDPTADSITIGHMLTVMAMIHLQRAGHVPIALMGGGTGMIGDPTDKMESRQMMSVEEIERNVRGIRAQFEKFLDFSDGRAIMANNADWLMHMNYVQTLREVCVHFSVNKMLTADAFRTRMERQAGLSLFELNYMVLQAYDFLELNRRYGCTMQMGGRDQWSNIIAGVDLIRRIEQKDAYGLTFALLTRADGEKMGKSLGGAIYLDPNRTSPYELFQYFRNTDDRDVEKYLKIFTFLPIDEIERIVSGDINEAKKVLAHSITSLIHGEQAAREAQDAAAALFGGGGDNAAMPITELEPPELDGMSLPALLARTGLAPSISEARRLIAQGGITLSGEKADDPAKLITAGDFKDGELIIRKGKKTFHKVKLT
ncbi:MAG: tyrosine--tRNA ligase [Defluviitaleaceae bacterium]|nr:tyrosine--tRNA ligase [Defluviitaleaceae bacterium]MCL2836656.1 tyrosine--tRNA ligase [Defluviitaleaceae bacterium]